MLEIIVSLIIWGLFISFLLYCLFELIKTIILIVIGLIAMFNELPDWIKGVIATLLLIIILL